jgi:mannitol/fructose-specific phosphotransferase system IIA component (Ntr-type)
MAHTNLAQLLRPEAIKLELNAKTKNAALREVAELLVPRQCIVNFDTFYREILERERVSNTALGHDVAIPHARTEQCTEILIAVGRSSAGIEFGPAEDSRVRLIFLIGTPKQMVTDYLHLVGNLARLLRRDDLRQNLLAAPDSAAFVRVVAEAAS